MKRYGNFKDFIVFVRSQPEGRAIDNSGGWGECAVGDFLRGKGFFEQSSFYMVGDWFRRICPEVEIYNKMNYHTTCPDTYGELANLLKEHGY